MIERFKINFKKATVGNGLCNDYIGVTTGWEKPLIKVDKQTNPNS